VCDYLSIKKDIRSYTEMNLSIDPLVEPDDWALNISKALNADEYRNLPGGKSIFNREKFDKANITLNFHQIAVDEYPQKANTTFEPNLSILDVIMYNSPEKINQMLDNYKHFI
jgi:hypothetical protein